MRFTYNNKATKPLSFSLNIKDITYTEKQCKAYFGGLLPENNDIRKALAIKYKINPNNDFALLASIGHDCAGAVSFHKLDEPQFEQTFICLKAVSSIGLTIPPVEIRKILDTEFFLT